MTLRFRFLLLIFVCYFQVSAQSDAINSLVKSFNTYQSKTLQEKLFVHTDRNFYITGEVLWFKIYATEATSNIPLAISKVAYVEIMGMDNKAILQTKVELSEGVGNGSLFLPASIPSGNYTFRAYTNWMKNTDPEFFFHQQITIVNTFKNLELPKEGIAATTSVDLKFFPEGGNLVSSLGSSVAFKISDQNGRGVNADGIVLDNGRDTVARFTTHRFGMGTFTFTPQAAHSYEAILLSGKSKTKYKLPAALDSGCTVHLEETAENKITLSVRSTYGQSSQVYLIVHSENSVKASKSNVLINGKTQFVFAKDQLGKGLIRFTLFDYNLQPVAERLYFIRKKNKSLLNLTSDKDSYTNRQKISLTILSSDSLLTDGFSGSMAVHSYDSMLYKEPVDIATYSELTSELKGSIEFPEYYLQTGDANALDNLMLVHGWSRYSWKSILADEGSDSTYLHLPELRGHLITGNVINKFSGVAMPEVTAVLGAPNKIIRSYISQSNSDGNIYFEMKDFFDAQRIFVQVLPVDKDSAKIQINDPFSSAFSSFKANPFKLNATAEKALLQRSIAMQSLNIFQPAYTGTPVQVKTDSVNFYGKADEDYLLDDYTRFKSMEEVMREYVPGVMVKKRKENFTMRVINKPVNQLFENHPLVLLDGVPIFDADQVMEYDPLKIKRLEVMTRSYFIGALEADGIVSMTTFRGLAEGLEIDPETVSLDYEGLQRQREFYSPDYSTVAAIQNRAADFRDLLYWNPSVKPDKEGKIHLEFYSSDKLGKYEINIQGIGKDGKIGSGRSFFSTVK